MTEGMIGKVLDFVKWILESIFPSKFKKKELPKVINLTAIYDRTRAEMSKSRVGLLEILEDSPEQKFQMDTIHEVWQKKMAVWFRTEEQEASKGECDAILRDWANDNHPVVIRTKSKSGNTLWQLNPEYEDRRTKRDEDRTVFRSADQDITSRGWEDNT